MINFNRNNLDKAISPYLQQHKTNPIHWQEWGKEALDYARNKNKILFFSVGYATCHWCHVMASEAFSDKKIASFLNEHFVSIKVDREERPDIDKYLMSFIINTQGSGGWPLNVFLTPGLRIILAVTYISIEARYGMPGFIDLLNLIKKRYDSGNDKFVRYEMPLIKKEDFEEKELIEAILSAWDMENGGIGSGPKFPPHNTLVFLISYYEKNKNKDVKIIVEKTLDVMLMRGLHDHLQGGFYRYCIDARWTIPHFEKMLYDQAMMLWVYSFAYKVFNKEAYKTAAKNIIKCLEETFEEKGLFYSAHDADTNHLEGSTYLWTIKELQKNLSKEDFNRLSEVYLIRGEGNFEGKNHLIKISLSFLPDIEEKLLESRKKRDQPFTDKKILTSWNSLLGVALVISYRCSIDEKSFDKAYLLFNNLLKKHYQSKKLAHSSFGNKIQKDEYLEDYSAMLLFATYIYEEKGEYKDIVESFLKATERFNIGHRFLESNNEDFMEVYAQEHDMPTPSSISLADYATFRANILLGKDCKAGRYSSPISHDFFNFVNFLRNGNIHEIHTPSKISWKKLPLNSMQVKSDKIQDCYSMACREFKSEEELINSIK